MREVWSAAEDKVLRVRMPAGGQLGLRERVANPEDSPAQELLRDVLVPDFGTAPVARYREVFRRLAMLWGEARLGETWTTRDPNLSSALRIAMAPVHGVATGAP